MPDLRVFHWGGADTGVQSDPEAVGPLQQPGGGGGTDPEAGRRVR